MGIVLPNVRKIIIPDPNHCIVEGDLKGADAQVVAWEAEDEDLKAAFRAGIDVHEKNAEDMWGSEFTRLPAGSYARRDKRQECKHTVHGCNYGCTPRTTAIQRGWLVAEAERFHRRWFSLHPGIEKNFHGKVRKCLAKDKVIWNAFGFRRQFFDRIDSCFTEALAWIPQSTVALNSFRGIEQLVARFPTIEELGQNHDSEIFQHPIKTMPPLWEIRKTLEVVTPYPDPLVIPWDIKLSWQSWGHVEKPCKCDILPSSECLCCLD